MLESFSQSFSEARAKFLDAARMARATVNSHARDDIRGRDGEELACDVAVLGDAAASSAALIVSGTHGAEGFCGSAIQHRWLLDQAGEHAASGVRVVLVHAINPWAFSHKTRATETNIDLNRNFLDGGYGKRNAAYDRLQLFLHGSAHDAGEHFRAYLAYRAYLDTNGWSLEIESFEGQGTWPDGIFYTGDAPAWSNTLFRRILRDTLSGVERVGFIDWHTGIGSYGEVVSLLFDDKGSEEYAVAARWWGLTHGGDGAFRTGSAPKYDGLLCRAIGHELPGARVAGAVVEFGTADDYAIFRGDRMDRWLRFEGNSDPEHERMRDEYRKLCCPDDIGWQRFVLATGPTMIDEMLAGLREWSADTA